MSFRFDFENSKKCNGCIVVGVLCTFVNNISSNNLALIMNLRIIISLEHFA